MSGDQQATTKWMIRVDGSDLTSVEAGQTVEIGRKPLRPLSDDGTTRVEILDDTRSPADKFSPLSLRSAQETATRCPQHTSNPVFRVRIVNARASRSKDESSQNFSS